MKLMSFVCLLHAMCSSRTKNIGKPWWTKPHLFYKEPKSDHFVLGQFPDTSSYLGNTSLSQIHFVESVQDRGLWTSKITFKTAKYVCLQSKISLSASPQPEYTWCSLALSFSFFSSSSSFLVHPMVCACFPNFLFQTLLPKTKVFWAACL